MARSSTDANQSLSDETLSSTVAPSPVKATTSMGGYGTCEPTFQCARFFVAGAAAMDGTRPMSSAARGCTYPSLGCTLEKFWRCTS